MRITESQLRRIVKRMIREQADQTVLPQVGDHFACLGKNLRTDQAKTDIGGKNYYQQIFWDRGDVVEVVKVEPIKGFGFSSQMMRAPDVDDKFMRRASPGMPVRAPTGGLVDDYLISFRSLTPKTAIKGVLGDQYLSPDHDPKNAVYSLNTDLFLRNFTQQ